MTDERRTCGNCAFYAVDQNDLSKGDCRGNLPNLYPMPGGGPGQFLFVTKWPTVQRDFKACARHLTEEERESSMPNAIVTPVYDKDIKRRN